MGRSPRRRSAKRSPDRPAANAKPNKRYETFRSVNRSVKTRNAAFLCLPAAGFLLISQARLQVVLPPDALYALSAALTGAVLSRTRSRRHRW
ncbi:hypothetical protein GCM10010278_84180 [Streptomyces melanogenes]|nr:hypothetical protein GCM10010278_84180 [Streptomyces melanogenes]